MKHFMASLWTPKFTVIVFLFSALCCSAQQPGDIDASFNNQTTPGSYGGNERIESAIQLAGGKILVAGYFTSYNQTNRKYIARLFSDGRLDPAFDAGIGPDQPIYAMKVQQDGKIIIGGAFNSINGIPVNRIARLNENGTLDVTFNPGSGFNNSVECIHVQANGKILVGGYFTAYNGIPSKYIIRLNPDGSVDGSFNAGEGPNNVVEAISELSDEKILLVGMFDTYSGESRKGIVRINSNGGLDGSFTPGLAPSQFSTVHLYAIVVQPDGKTVVGGDLPKGVARLNADGTLDPSFNPGAGANSYPVSIALQGDKIFLGGHFSSFDGSVRTRVARLNGDGSLDVAFNPGSGANNSVRTILPQSDGTIIIAGVFTTFGGKIRDGLAKLNPDGTLSSTLNAGTAANSHIRSVSIQADKKIIIGGDFTAYNAVPVNRVARLNTDGSVDEEFNVGSGTNNPVHATLIQPDGKILLAGAFATYRNVGRNRIARLNTNGSIDDTFNPGFGVNGIVYCMALQSDGKILIGGVFTTYNGVAVNNLVRLKANGELDVSFDVGSGPNNYVYAIAVQNDGKIYVGGAFSSFNNIFRSKLVRLNGNGSLDNAFAPPETPDNTVRSIIIQDDGKILFGAGSGQSGLQSGNLIERYNPNGIFDETFDPGTSVNSDVNSIILQPDGKIIIAGNFTTYDGTARNRIARLNSNGDLDITFNPGVGFNQSALAMALQDDGKVLVAGSFNDLSGNVANRLARVYTKPGQVITFEPPAEKSYGSPAFGLTGSSNAGLPITFNSSNTDIASVTGQTITILKVGSTTITASQSGDAMFASASDVKRELVVKPAMLTITGIMVDDKVYDGTTTATFTGGILNGLLPQDEGKVSLTSDATFVDSNAGTGKIVSGFGLSGPAASNYTLAASTDIRANIAQASQTITFNMLASTTLGVKAFSIDAVSTSSLPVIFTATTAVITIKDKEVTLIGAGLATIVATQPGNMNYKPAPSVQQMFCINSPKPGIQVSDLGSEAPVLQSSSPSNNQWFKDGQEISGQTGASLTVTDEGIYTLKVVIDGCASEFSDPEALIVTGLDFEKKDITVYPNPTSHKITIDVHALQLREETPVSIIDINGRKVLESFVLQTQTLDVSNLPPGAYLVRIIDSKRSISKILMKQ